MTVPIALSVRIQHADPASLGFAGLWVAAVASLLLVLVLFARRAEAHCCASPSPPAPS